MIKKLFLFIILILSIQTEIICQVRIAVFPFQNRDGDMKFNVWCYKLQDSLFKELFTKDPEQKYFILIPADSIEMMLAEMNLDPNNPQYDTDMWTAAEKLNVKKVITGNFNYQAERFLINAFIYDVRMRLPHPTYQARDIFKGEERLFESIPIIVEGLLPAFIKNK